MVGATVVGAPGLAGAHSGGTDKYGCHAGSRPRHCHRGGDRSVEIPPDEFFSVPDGPDVGSVTTPPPPPTSDVTPPLVPRIVKWFIKGAILTIIFSGDGDSSIDIVSDVAGVVATFVGSSAEQTAEIELGPFAEEFTVVATDQAGNESTTEPIYVEATTTTTTAPPVDGGYTASQRAEREDGGSAPNLLLIGGLVAGAAALGGGVEYTRRRRARARVAAFDLDGDWAGSRKGGGPLEPPGDF